MAGPLYGQFSPLVLNQVSRRCQRSGVLECWECCKDLLLQSSRPPCILWEAALVCWAQPYRSVFRRVLASVSVRAFAVPPALSGQTVTFA